MNALVKLVLSFTAVQWVRNTSEVWFKPLLLIFVVWIVHGEYLDYLSRTSPGEQDNTILGISYVLKWALVVFAMAWFVLRLKKQQRHLASVLDDKKRVKVARSTPDDKAVKQKPAVDDGFDFLRNKKKLESRSEKIIKGKDV